jgi:hypothetical protein
LYGSRKLSQIPEPNERGEQIREWVRSHQAFERERFDLDAGPPRYAVVDDLDLGITAAGHPFVQTDGRVGLTVGGAYDYTPTAWLFDSWVIETL